MKGRTEDKDLHPILHFTTALDFFHKRLFSLSCFGVQVVLDYKFCLVYAIGIWGAFLASSDFLVFIAFKLPIKKNSNSGRMHHFASLLSKYAQVFQLPKHRFKQRPNAPFCVIDFKFPSSSNFKNIVSNSIRMHHFASLLLIFCQQFHLQEHRLK